MASFEVWESAYDLYDWSNSVPEVADSGLQVIKSGVKLKQCEHTPKPKCKSYGYSTWEWLMHWHKILKNTVLGLTPSESMEDYKRMLAARKQIQ